MSAWLDSLPLWAALLPLAGYLLLLAAAHARRRPTVVSGTWDGILLAVGLAGSALGLLMPGLPLAEVLVALTLALVAGVLLGWLPSVLVVPAMAIHGYVLSDAVLGWTTMPVFNYLAGLLISQGLLLLLALQVLRPLAARLSLAGRRCTALGLVGASVALALAMELG